MKTKVRKMKEGRKEGRTKYEGGEGSKQDEGREKER